MTKSNTRQTADIAHVVGRKNLIINGDMRISQRGDYTGTPTALTTGVYLIDRYRPYLAAMAGTLQHTSPSINGIPKKAMKIAATNTASGEIAIQHLVENLSVEVGQTYTLSAKVRSNASNVRLRAYTGSAWVTGNIHTGGGDWETLTLTFTNNYTNHPPIQVYTNSQTVGDYFEFTELQMEVGSVATDFEHRSYGEELALCLRYFWRYDEHSSANTLCGAISSQAYREPLFWPVVMRSAPAISVGTISNGGGSDVTSNISFGSLTTTSCLIIGSVGMTTARLSVDWLEADAEL